MKTTISYFIIFLFIVFFLFLGCDKSSVNPAEKSTTVQFVFSQSGSSGNQFSLLKDILHDPLQQPAPTASIQQKRASRFQKSSTINEAKVLVLDMTQWESDSVFLEEWYHSGQYNLFDTTLWDTTRDFWDNVLAIFKSYTGNYYRYAGEYNLTIKDTIASGTVMVTPGLNYFFICLRENGQTVDFDEIFAMIEEGEKNVITYEGQPAVYVEIYSPQDGGVFVSGQPITFYGWGWDRINDISIPDQNLVWRSDKDGILGTGSFFERSDLSINTHRITLTGTSISGGSGSKQVTITVVQ